jgi:hypothetical protein
MKHITLFCLLVMSISTSAFAGRESNGGDACEDRFKIIRDDIQSWILKEGSASLALPKEVSLGQYNVAMLSALAQADISCSDEKIQIGIKEKTCENFRDAAGVAHIKCNRKAFSETDADDQYILVHHEYAGLAGLEVAPDGDSHYTISNQISGFLENQVVRRLVVTPAGAEPTSTAACASVVHIGLSDGSNKFVRGPALSMNGKHFDDVFLPGYKSVIYSVLADKSGGIILNMELSKGSNHNDVFVNMTSSGFAAGDLYTILHYNNMRAIGQPRDRCKILSFDVTCAANLERANQLAFEQQPDFEKMPRGCSF